MESDTLSTLILSKHKIPETRGTRRRVEAPVLCTAQRVHGPGASQASAGRGDPQYAACCAVMCWVRTAVAAVFTIGQSVATGDISIRLQMALYALSRKSLCLVVRQPHVRCCIDGRHTPAIDTSSMHTTRKAYARRVRPVRRIAGIECNAATFQRQRAGHQSRC